MLSIINSTSSELYFLIALVINLLMPDALIGSLINPNSLGSLSLSINLPRDVSTNSLFTLTLNGSLNLIFPSENER